MERSVNEEKCKSFVEDFCNILTTGRVLVEVDNIIDDKDTQIATLTAQLAEANATIEAMKRKEE